MRFKDLEWKDIVSDNVVVSSHCIINLCGVIKIEFQINHDPKDNQYYLYAFGKGSIRRLQPEKCGSVESAKNVAYRIYSNEMERIKKAVDYLVVTKKSNEKIVLRAVFFLFEEILIGGSTDILTNSREIAIRFKKRHNSILRTIGRITKKNPELSKYFMESSYISKDGRHLIQYDIDDMGADILKNRFKYDVRSARFEYKYLNEIKDFLNLMNVDSVEQYQVGNYRMDLYIPKYNTAIEIDEEEHKYKKDYDTIRQKYIVNQIHCKFIRINEGESCGSALARIVKELYKSA